MTTDRLVEAQPAGLSLPGVVTLSPQDGELLDRVRALRDAVATATAVSWQAAPAAHLDTAALHHLPPPWVAGPAPDWLTRWRAAYRYALCYYRQGDGFAVVSDRRAVAAAHRRVVDAAEWTVLRECATPCPLPADGEWRAAAASLQDASLLLVAGGRALTLPYRLTRWPIPATAV